MSDDIISKFIVDGDEGIASVNRIADAMKKAAGETDVASKATVAHGKALEETTGKARGMFAGMAQGSNEIEKFGRGLLNSTAGISVFAGGAVAAGVVVGNFVTDSVGKFQALESEVANISSIAPEIDTSKLFSQLSDLQTKIPATSQALAQSYYNIASSVTGSQQQLLDLTEKTARGAIAARTDTQTWASATIGLMQAYHLSLDQVDTVQDKLFTGIKNGVFTGQQLATQLGELAQSGHTAGVSLDELMALIVAVSREGGNFAQNANNLNNYLQKIQTKEAQAQLQQLQVQVVDSNGKYRDQIQVLTELGQALAGMTEGARSHALQDIFPDLQARQALTVLLSELPGIPHWLDESKDSAGQAEQAIGKAMDTSAAKTQLATGRVNEFKEGLGGAISTGGINLIDAHVTAWEELGKKIHEATQALAEFNNNVPIFQHVATDAENNAAAVAKQAEQTRILGKYMREANDEANRAKANAAQPPSYDPLTEGEQQGQAVDNAAHTPGVPTPDPGYSDEQRKEEEARARAAQEDAGKVLEQEEKDAKKLKDAMEKAAEAKRQYDEAMQRNAGAQATAAAQEHLNQVTAEYKKQLDAADDALDRDSKSAKAAEKQATDAVTAAQDNLNNVTASYKVLLSDLAAQERAVTAAEKADLADQQTVIDALKSNLTGFTEASTDAIRNMDTEINNETLDLQYLKEAGTNAMSILEANAREATDALARLREETQAGDEALQNLAASYDAKMREANRQQRNDMMSYDAAVAAITERIKNEEAAIKDIAARYDGELIPAQRRLRELQEEEARDDRAKKLHDEGVSIENLAAQMAQLIPGSARYLELQRQQNELRKAHTRHEEEAGLEDRIAKLEDEKKAETERAQAQIEADRAALAQAQERQRAEAQLWADRKELIQAEIDAVAEQRRKYDRQQREREQQAQGDVTRTTNAVQNFKDYTRAEESAKQTELDALLFLRAGRSQADGEHERLLNNEISRLTLSADSIKKSYEEQISKINDETAALTLTAGQAEDTAKAVVKAAQDMEKDTKDHWQAIIDKDNDYRTGIQDTATKQEESARTQVNALQNVQQEIANNLSLINAYNAAIKSGASVPFPTLTHKFTLPNPGEQGGGAGANPNADPKTNPAGTTDNTKGDGAFTTKSVGGFTPAAQQAAGNITNNRTVNIANLPIYITSNLTADVLRDPAFREDLINTIAQGLEAATYSD